MSVKLVRVITGPEQAWYSSCIGLEIMVQEVQIPERIYLFGIGLMLNPKDCLELRQGEQTMELTFPSLIIGIA